MSASPRTWVYSCITATAAMFVAAVLHFTGALDRLEATTWAWRARTLAVPTPSTDKIKIIALEQACLDWAETENGLSWPWPRELYSAVVEFCRAGGATFIAFDVVYSEASAYGVEDDQAFAQALKNIPHALAAPMGVGQDSPASFPLRGFTTHGLIPWTSHPKRQRLSVQKATLPIDELTQDALHLGDVMVRPDDDGVVRRVHPIRAFGSHSVPILGLTPLAGDDITWTLDNDTLSLNAHTLHLDNNGTALLRFRGPSGTHETFLAHHIIRSALLMAEGKKPSIDPAVFKNTYVFFGFSAAGLKDERSTPISKSYPGVEVHATLLDNALEGDNLRHMPGWMVLITLAILTFGFASLLLRATTIQGLWALSFTAIILPLVAAWLGYMGGVWFPLVSHETASVVTLMLSLGIKYRTEGAQKRFIKSAFQMYLSRQVIDRFIADPDKLRLGGERRNLSIFFSDLQGFSSIAEQMEPEALTTMLNDYLTDMTNIIMFENQGTLDKYEGDAIIAFWNAPLNCDNHAQVSVEAAIACQNQLAKRRAEFTERCGRELHMRIGINTGDVVVGNMGSRDRFDYTVLGDAANLAARLEGANKVFGTYTMISESTKNALNDHILCRYLGPIRVVGRDTPVKVYEPISAASAISASEVEVFHQALQQVEAKDWTSALACFDKLPHDPASDTYKTHIETILMAGTDWDGTWNLSSK